MGDGTKENPFTREDVLRLIEENGGTAQGLDLSKQVFEEGIDLSVLKLEGIILKEASLVRANLEGSRLWGAHLERANLMFANLERTGLQFAYLEGTILWEADFSSDTKLYDVRWGSYILGEERKENFSAAALTYNRLKILHNNFGLHDIAGIFFYREQESKRKTIQSDIYKLIKKTKYKKILSVLGKLKRRIWNLLWFWLYRLSCGYGEKPWRVVAWGLLVLIGFALIYFLLRGVAPYDLSARAFVNSLYYSAVSFTALGYGPWFNDTSVHSWVQGAGAVEAFIGVFTIALFLVTFIRKMTR